MSVKIELSEIDISNAIQLARRGFTFTDIAEALGIGRSAFYARMKRRPDIKHRLNRAKQGYHTELAEKARELALEGDKDMIKFLLTRRFQYTEKHEIDLNEKNNDTEKTRDELIEEIIKLAKRNDVVVTDEEDPGVVH